MGDTEESLEKQAEISKKRTNQSYREIHEWIDDPPHKDERHDITKIPDNFQMFEGKYGEEAARDCVQHLADDLNGKFNHLIEDIQAMIAIDRRVSIFPGFSCATVFIAITAMAQANV